MLNSASLTPPGAIANKSPFNNTLVHDSTEPGVNSYNSIISDTPFIYFSNY